MSAILHGTSPSKNGADAELARSLHLLQAGNFVAARDCAYGILALHPEMAMAHNNLGFALQNLDCLEEAVQAYRTALNLAPGLRLARHNLILLLARQARRQECMALVHAELLCDDGMLWLQRQIEKALQTNCFNLAGELAMISAALRLGSDFYPEWKPDSLRPFPILAPRRNVSVEKLTHDADQMAYLQQKDILDSRLTPLIEQYRISSRGLSAKGTDKKPCADEVLKSMDGIYNRIFHIRDTPRLPGNALSESWSRSQAEEAYLSQKLGLVVIDNFLNKSALDELRAFCLESTFWSGNRYRDGRLGAFFHDGFNCPLLLQIAEEIQSAFPRLIGGKHPLTQMWGFKNAPQQPANTTTHADFAAVNVNFWITPDEANLEPLSGGLIVFDVDAPPNWDFMTYNGRSDVISSFLHQKSAKAIKIPYRQNRAMIFNSDIFHATDKVHFRPDYENRRINVTMLWGVREQDEKRISAPQPVVIPGTMPWRSAALSRSRFRR